MEVIGMRRNLKPIKTAILQGYNVVMELLGIANFAFRLQFVTDEREAKCHKIYGNRQ